MPPPPTSQKGTGKKGRDGARQSRSRNTTPSLAGRSSLPPNDTGDTALLNLPLQNFQTADELAELYHHHAIPSAKELDALLERIRNLQKIVDMRGDICDKGMRLLAKARKERFEDIENERRDEERKERVKKEAIEEEERKANKKKRKDQSAAKEETRPLTHGAHGLAPQDGSKLASSPSQRSRRRSRESASSSLSPALSPVVATGVEIEDKETKPLEEDSSEDEHQPAPAPAIPHLQTFGDDPSTFPDPTIYEVLEITDHMDIETKKQIYSVAVFPETDLADLIPGNPPDKDFSVAKPTNQVQASTFATYIEPFFKPYTEEDLAFLRERGDRTNAFIIPRRGKRHYTEIWAEEDGITSNDTPVQGKDKLSSTDARGKVEDIDDATAQTDQVSSGPILSRLLAALRPEHRVHTTEEKPITNGLTNGEASTNGDANADLDLILGNIDAPITLPPATQMAESSSEAWKKAVHTDLPYHQVEERIKNELRYIGLLPPDTELDYTHHFDDEIAARLRYLQEQLKEQCILNGARKARLMELTKERMAHQEYTTILEDLDGQVQTAYMKRTRTMGKSKKAKKPGGAGGGSHAAGTGGSGTARPGIGDVTKTLMERRMKWIDSIGKVFEDERTIMAVPRASDEGSSIFKPEDMGELIKREKQAWDEEADEE